MKGLEKLTFLSREQIERLELSETNYKRFTRVYFAVISAIGNEIVVKVWQQENVAERYLSAKELVERGKEVFEGVISEGVKLHFRPIPFKDEPLVSVDAAYVASKMTEHNLQLKDLVKLLNIDKSTLSRTLSAEDMTKSSKAMFYFLFKYLETKKNE